jgi:hypothetical protein
MSSQIEVTTYVDVDELLEDVSDKLLLEEVSARKLIPGAEDNCAVTIFDDWADDLRRAARAGDWTHLEIVLWRRRPTQHGTSPKQGLPLAAPGARPC